MKRRFDLTSRRAWLPWLCLGALVAPAAAQADPMDFADRPDSSEAFRLLKERQRDLAHPGNPLRIVGVFDEDNSLTSTRGALGRSSFTPVQVDPNEAYERQLAMLEKRSTFSTGHAALRESDGAMPRAREPRHRGASDDPEPSSSLGAWMAALAVAALGSCALVLQTRR